MFSVGNEIHKHIFIYVSFINTSFKYVIRIFVYVYFPTEDFQPVSKVRLLSYPSTIKNRLTPLSLKLCKLLFVQVENSTFIHTFIICLACLPTNIMLLLIISYISKKSLLGTQFGFTNFYNLVCYLERSEFILDF